MVEDIVTVTKKGQATIPKKLREKHRITRKAIAVDTKDGVLLKAISDPLAEKGSLEELFSGTTSGRLVREARRDEIKKQKKLERRTAG
ncbi:MAG: AbrB/MazE/SpoVT family DNA-binding domain-containing protein [Thaumarchaeota archaeon]|nr:AbrB/MazE/SpoVT family DNA-binding domain-containing protein [Nitrososphaerota archaeon]